MPSVGGANKRAIIGTLILVGRKTETPQGQERAIAKLLMVIQLNWR